MLDVEPHDTCFFDYVDVFDGNSSSSAHLEGSPFCGSLPENIAPIISTGRFMLVRFTSDTLHQHGGFTLEYNAIVGEQYFVSIIIIFHVFNEENTN